MILLSPDLIERAFGYHQFKAINAVFQDCRLLAFEMQSVGNFSCTFEVAVDSRDTNLLPWYLTIDFVSDAFCFESGDDQKNTSVERLEASINFLKSDIAGLKGYFSHITYSRILFKPKIKNRGRYKD